MIFLLSEIPTFLLMTTKFIQCSQKGQVTIPKKWRDMFDTDCFVAYLEKGSIVFKPHKIDFIPKEEGDNEEVIFNADRDNDGKGIPIEDIIQMLEEMKDE